MSNFLIVRFPRVNYISICHRGDNFGMCVCVSEWENEYAMIANHNGLNRKQEDTTRITKWMLARSSCFTVFSFVCPSAPHNQSDTQNTNSYKMSLFLIYSTEKGNISNWIIFFFFLDYFESIYCSFGVLSVVCEFSCCA